MIGYLRRAEARDRAVRTQRNGGALILRAHDVALLFRTIGFRSYPNRITEMVTLYAARPWWVRRPWLGDPVAIVRIAHEPRRIVIWAMDDTVKRAIAPYAEWIARCFSCEVTLT